MEEAQEIETLPVKVEPSGAVQAAQPSAVSPFDRDPAEFMAGLERRRANHKALIQWVNAALVEDVDFGRIHISKGCDKGRYCTNQRHFSKPSLWKPGAEKICGMLGMNVTFPNMKDYEQAAVSGIALETILLRCHLTDSFGNVLAEGAGARSVAKEYGDVNKAIKMASKSAHIDATLRLAGLSEVFTQDVEDMVKDSAKEPEQEMTPELQRQIDIAALAALEAIEATGKMTAVERTDLEKLREKLAEEPPPTTTKAAPTKPGRSTGTTKPVFTVDGQCQCGSILEQRTSAKGVPFVTCKLQYDAKYGNSDSSKAMLEALEKANPALTGNHYYKPGKRQEAASQ